MRSSSRVALLALLVAIALTGLLLQGTQSVKGGSPLAGSEFPVGVWRILTSKGYEIGFSAIPPINRSGEPVLIYDVLPVINGSVRAGTPWGFTSCAGPPRRLFYGSRQLNPNVIISSLARTLLVPSRGLQLCPRLELEFAFGFPPRSGSDHGNGLIFEFQRRDGTRGSVEFQSQSFGVSSNGGAF